MPPPVADVFATLLPQLGARPNASAAPSAFTPRPSVKGQQTKAHIVDVALRQSMRQGLESLSMGGLAEAVGMSKSGVFAHFGSREELQLSVIAEYHQRFEREVFQPALQHPRGLARLRALFGYWMQRTAVELDSGCIYISGAVEFEHREGVVRDALTGLVQAWRGALERAVLQCQELGELTPGRDVAQMLFEIHGLILALHYDARFMRTPGAWQRALAGFEEILQRYGAAPAGPELAAV